MIRLVGTLLILLAFSGQSALAQDKLYKKKGEILKVHILEVGIDEIKYRLFDDPNGPVYVLDKERILKVEYENGKTETYSAALNDPESYTGQHTHAIKIGFLSPLSGYLPVTYEKNLGLGKAVELTVGFIGAGKSQSISGYDPQTGQYREYKRDPFGIHFAAGYKLNKLPTYFNRGVRMNHLMQGFYVRPTLNIGFYKDNAPTYKNGQQTIEKRNVSFGALTLDLGQQWVFQNRFLIDLYIGFGYAFDNVKQDEWYDFAQDHFPIKLIGESDGFGLCSGFKIGYLFK